MQTFAFQRVVSASLVVNRSLSHLEHVSNMALEMTHKFSSFNMLSMRLWETHKLSQFKSHSECACGAHTSLYFSRVFQAKLCGEHTNLPV